MRDNSARFKALSGPGLILYGFTITFAVIDWVMSLDPSWISTIFGLSFLIGQVLSALCFAIVVERILYRYKPMSELLKPEQVHDHGKFMLDLHHGVGLLRVFAVAHHLGGQLARRNYLVHAAAEWRLGIRWIVPGVVPLRRAVCAFDFASFQTRYHAPGLAGRLDDADAVCGPVLDHRAKFFRDFQSDLAGRGGSDCDRRSVAGVFLPQPEFEAAGSRL